jgi:hypothetical protein
MFKFFSKNSVDEAVNCAYLATKMLEFKGKIEIGEEDEKVESLAEKMIAEIVEVEGTSLENFSDEAIRRYIRIVSEWVDATIFTKELTLSDLRKGEEIVNLWLESEVSDRNEAKAENERLKEAIDTMDGYLEGIKRERGLSIPGTPWAAIDKNPELSTSYLPERYLGKSDILQYARDLSELQRIRVLAHNLKIRALPVKIDITKKDPEFEK